MSSGACAACRAGWFPNMRSTVLANSAGDCDAFRALDSIA